MRIKTLSLQLANQIAAGEVVERPASVVKELLENAIDAHSRQIHIEIERGGSALIRIVDDGDGINKDDLVLAVTRHATSKISTLNELEQIMSLGFRGEALASISAVSKLSLKSKALEQDQAWMIDTGTRNDFANYQALPEPVAHPQGTTVDVRDLFFNTPARRKFMRTIKTEFKHIDDIVKRIALSQFDIAFKLSHNKKLVRNLPKAMTEKAIVQRISKLFSPDFLENSHKIDYLSNHFKDMGQIRIWGWVSTPQWNRKQSDWQYFYVNGRYIKDKLVNHALRQAYQEYLPEDSFSAYLLYLEIDPQQVDVNVHPTKHEVRFRQTRLVHDLIYSALKDVLFPTKEASEEDSELITEASSETASFVAEQGNYYNPYSLKKDKRAVANYGRLQNHIKADKLQTDEQINALTQLYQSKKQRSDNLSQEDNNLTTGAADTQPVQAPAVCHKAKSFFGSPMGCLIPNYVMSQLVNDEQQVQIYVVHVVRAQRFLFRRLFQTGQTKALLIPETMSLSSEQIESLIKFQAVFSNWGLELNQLGEDSLIVRKLPHLCNIPGCKLEMSKFIQLLIQVIKQKASIDESDMMTISVEAIYSDSLSETEQERLLTMLTEQIQLLGAEQINRNKPAIWKLLDALNLEELLF